MKYSPLLLTAGFIFPFFSLSCEKEKAQNDALSADSLTSSGDPSVARRSNRRVSSISSKATVSERSMIGKSLRAGDEGLFDQWVQELSRNDNEQTHRRQQLSHMRRAEVLDWQISHQDVKPVKEGDEPTKIELPFFGGQTLAVFVSKVRRFGQQSVHVEGYLAEDPESKVYLSLTNQSPTVTIEGPNTLYYYEAFEDVVILREDTAGSQNADFDCNCELHKSEAAK